MLKKYDDPLDRATVKQVRRENILPTLTCMLLAFIPALAVYVIGANWFGAIVTLLIFEAVALTTAFNLHSDDVKRSLRTARKERKYEEQRVSTERRRRFMNFLTDNDSIATKKFCEKVRVENIGLGSVAPQSSIAEMFNGYIKDLERDEVEYLKDTFHSAAGESFAHYERVRALRVLGVLQDPINAALDHVEATNAVETQRPQLIIDIDDITEHEWYIIESYIKTAKNCESYLSKKLLPAEDYDRGVAHIDGMVDALILAFELSREKRVVEARQALDMAILESPTCMVFDEMIMPTSRWRSEV